MIHGLTLTGAALLSFCVFAETGREVGFKLASGGGGAPDHFVVGVLKSPFLWLAITLGIAEFFAWFIVLQNAPLNIAYPLISLAYVGVPAAGALFLGERMTGRQLAGAALIALGVGCVALSGL